MIRAKKGSYLQLDKFWQVIDETLSPTWDELLVINDVVVYGTKDEIKNDPPMVVIEIFDQDKVVSSHLKKYQNFFSSFYFRFILLCY